MSGLFIRILISLLSIYNYVLLARVLLSWVQTDSLRQIQIFLYKITEPVLAPIRRIMPSTGGWDFSPVVAFLLIGILIRFLTNIL
ncbi:MAG TPA: YggT family protein [Candidatus Cloacimonadota bacterium]|nr:YggT family protein [Candidatus Cloacimonadota bacterium]HPS39397.1 YggT family protein [Candidatus Cloacimonadota bacterium]